MKKSQIIAIIFAVAFVGGLYSLPRFVVDNEKDASTLEQTGGEEEEAPLNQMHDAPIEAAERENLNQLQQTFEGAAPVESLEIAEKIGSIYSKAGKYDSAAYYFDLAAERNSSVESWEKAGNAYYEAFTFALNKEKMESLADKTRTYLNKVLEKDPKRLDLKTKVAMTYVSSANPMQGITMLREVLEQDPTNEDGLYNMGVLSMQSGQYKKAAERFEELVKYHPDNIQGQFYLGVSYFESKQNTKAKKQFQVVQGMTEDPMILSGVESYLGRL